MIIVVCMFLCLKVLAQSTTMLLNLDRSFKIELAWLASGAYQALAGAVNSSILKCLPNIDSHVTLAQSRAKLLNLKEDMLYKMASRQSQSAVDSMASVVSKMLVGMPPHPESFKTAGGVFTSAWALFPHFVKHPVKGEDDLTGTEALVSKFGDLQKLLKKEKRPAQLYELDIFKAFATPHATQPKSNMQC